MHILMVWILFSSIALCFGIWVVTFTVEIDSYECFILPLLSWKNSLRLHVHELRLVFVNPGYLKADGFILQGRCWGKSLLQDHELEWYFLDQPSSEFWKFLAGSLVCSLWRCLLWRWKFGFYSKWLAHCFATCLPESLLPRSRTNEIHTLCSCNP